MAKIHIHRICRYFSRKILQQMPLTVKAIIIPLLGRVSIIVLKHLLRWFRRFWAPKWIIDEENVNSCEKIISTVFDLMYKCNVIIRRKSSAIQQLKTILLKNWRTLTTFRFIFINHKNVFYNNRKVGDVKCFSTLHFYQ